MRIRAKISFLAFTKSMTVAELILSQVLKSFTLLAKMKEDELGRARLDEEEMCEQQRRTAAGIVEWCEKQGRVKVTGRTDRAAPGEHLDW